MPGVAPCSQKKKKRLDLTIGLGILLLYTAVDPPGFFFFFFKWVTVGLSFLAGGDVPSYRCLSFPSVLLFSFYIYVPGMEEVVCASFGSSPIPFLPFIFCFLTSSIVERRGVEIVVLVVCTHLHLFSLSLFF